MTKREAKRLACKLTANLVYAWMCTGEHEYHTSGADVRQLEAALTELRRELERRATGAKEGA